MWGRYTPRHGALHGTPSTLSVNTSPLPGYLDAGYAPYLSCSTRNSILPFVPHVSEGALLCHRPALHHLYTPRLPALV